MEEEETTAVVTAPTIIPPEDLYDPALPNDLLQYWQRCRAERERQRLQKEQAEKWRQQQALQRAAQQERQALLQQGQYHILAQQLQQQQPSAAAVAVAAGRGRGRGVSNVPAWMQHKVGAAVGGGVATSTSRSSTDEPSSKRIKRPNEQEESSKKYD